MNLIRILLLALLPVLAATAVAREVPPVIAVPPDQAARGDLATLVLPVTMDLASVDGIVYRGFKSLGRTGNLSVRVLPGEREVSVRFSQLYQISADEHEIVKSKQMVLTFLAEAGKTYRVVHAKFRDVDDARRGMENFVVRIEDADGNNRVIRATQAVANWKGETTINQRKDLVNAELAASLAAPASAPAVPAAPAAAGSLNALELLKFAWRSASAEERAAFLAWSTANP